MNMLPDDTLNIICLQLPIPIVANLIKSCQQFHSYLNAVFWKRYILRNHKDYRLCNDNIIFEQISYIFRMSRLTHAIFHDFQYIRTDNTVISQHLFQLANRFVG